MRLKAKHLHPFCWKDSTQLIIIIIKPRHDTTQYNTTNKSNPKNNECAIKNTESDQTYSATSTSTVISNKTKCSHPTDNTMVQKKTV